MENTYIKQFSSVVASVDGVFVLAWVREQLPAVDFDGIEDEGAVAELLIAAVLPLDYAFGAAGVLGCRRC